MNNPFQRLNFIVLVEKIDVYIFLLNVYTLYVYIHFHVVPNLESVVMLVSVGILKFRL